MEERRVARALARPHRRSVARAVRSGPPVVLRPETAGARIRPRAAWVAAALPSPVLALRSLASAFAVVALAALGAPARADDLGTGTLAIAGAAITISPEAQTVPYDTPTVVDTHLEGFDPGQGTLPPDLEVQADLSGPEIDGVATLTTTPNQPFRIPRFSRKGEYRLENVRCALT